MVSFSLVTIDSATYMCGSFHRFRFRRSHEKRGTRYRAGVVFGGQTDGQCECGVSGWSGGVSVRSLDTRGTVARVPAVLA